MAGQGLGAILSAIGSGVSTGARGFQQQSEINRRADEDAQRLQIAMERLGLAESADLRAGEQLGLSRDILNETKRKNLVGESLTGRRVNLAETVGLGNLGISKKAQARLERKLAETLRSNAANEALAGRRADISETSLFRQGQKPELDFNLKNLTNIASIIRSMEDPDLGALGQANTTALQNIRRLASRKPVLGKATGTQPKQPMTDEELEAKIKALEKSTGQ